MWHNFRRSRRRSGSPTAQRHGRERERQPLLPIRTTWDVCRRALAEFVRLFSRRRRLRKRLTPEAHARLLHEVCGNNNRLGRRDELHAILDWAAHHSAGDAALLNLLGVVWEARGQPKVAKRCYGRAMRVDRGFEAAQQNMRRLYELDTFGRSKQSFAVGEASTDLWLANLTKRPGTRQTVQER